MTEPTNLTFWAFLERNWLWLVLGIVILANCTPRCSAGGGKVDGCGLRIEYAPPPVDGGEPSP